MFKTLKRIYIGTKGIRFIKKEIVELRNEIKELRTQFKEDNKEYNRILNNQITARYKVIFDLYEHIGRIREEMWN